MSGLTIGCVCRAVMDGHGYTAGIIAERAGWFTVLFPNEEIAELRADQCGPGRAFIRADLQPGDTVMHLEGDMRAYTVLSMDQYGNAEMTFDLHGTTSTRTSHAGNLLVCRRVRLADLYTDLGVPVPAEVARQCVMPELFGAVPA